MLVTALLVPATTWWASVRYYNGRREAESQQQLARLQEIREKYAGTMKDNELLREAIKNKDSRRAFFKSLSDGSAEFVLETKQRTTWNGQTDPDSVWHYQHRQANLMLVKHGLPALDVSRPLPDSPAVPKSLRIGDQK